MSLENVPGQYRARRFLKQLVRRNHVPHALLFSGMEGIGKKRVARELAKVLNCQDLRDDDCCDRCPSCRKLDEGSHPDLTWVESDGAFIKVGQIRTVQERLRFRPFEGRWRTVVVQDAQNLTEEASNAFLKLLEEPPQRNIFVLLALEPQMLLPTIVSRCCHVRFQPLEESWIADQLVQSGQASYAAARRLARLSDGSLERARRLAETDRLERWEQVLSTVRELKTSSMMDFFNQTAKWTKESDDLEGDLECIRLWLRDLLHSRLLNDHAPMLDLDEESLETASAVPVERLFQIYDFVENSVRDLRRNANKQLTLEGVCLALKDGLYGPSGWGPVSGKW